MAPSAREPQRPRTIAAALYGTVVATVVTGVPTELIPNPWFTRMTPVRAADILFWAGLSPLTGLLVATYVVGRRSRAGGQAPRPAC